MTIVHRSLYTWFIHLIFLIVLCLRLDPRTYWNWFLVFIPLWIFDANLLIFVIFEIIKKWRNLNRLKELLLKYQFYIAGVFLKIASEVLICLKLEYQHLEINIFAVFIPIWILLSSMIVYVLLNLMKARCVLML